LFHAFCGSGFQPRKSPDRVLPIILISGGRLHQVENLAFRVRRACFLLESLLAGLQSNRGKMPLPQDMDLLADRAAFVARKDPILLWAMKRRPVALGISVVGLLPATEPASQPVSNWENEKKISQKNIGNFMTRVKNSMQDHRDMQLLGLYFFIIPTGMNLF
jgi:hypothetical protein